jgi:hypothetical protein
VALNYLNDIGAKSLFYVLFVAGCFDSPFLFPHCFCDVAFRFPGAGEGVARRFLSDFDPNPGWVGL